MLIKQNFINGSGGGNAIMKDDSEFSIPKANNTQFDIDTGLNSISKFSFFGVSRNNGVSTEEVLAYDSRYPNKYTTSYCSQYGNQGGSNYNFGSLGNSYAFGIHSITGGVVRMITPNEGSDYYDLKDYFIFAAE